MWRGLDIQIRETSCNNSAILLKILMSLLQCNTFITTTSRLLAELPYQHSPTINEMVVVIFHVTLDVGLYVWLQFSVVPGSNHLEVGHKIWLLPAGFWSRSRPEPGYLAGAGAVTLALLRFQLQFQLKTYFTQIVYRYFITSIDVFSPLELKIKQELPYY